MRRLLLQSMVIALDSRAAQFKLLKALTHWHDIFDGALLVILEALGD